MRKQEEKLNTMNSFANGFKIMRDGKVITLTPEEMSDFRFFDKAIEGRDNLYTYGCNKAKAKKNSMQLQNLQVIPPSAEA